MHASQAQQACHRFDPFLVISSGTSVVLSSALKLAQLSAVQAGSLLVWTFSVHATLDTPNSGPG